MIAPRSVPDTRIRQLVLIVTTALVGLVASATAVMLAPLLPSFQVEYGVGPAAVTWALTAGSLVGGAGLVVMPRLADVVGDRTTMLIAGVSMVLGAGVCAVGNSFVALIIGSGLLGWGSVASVLGLALLRRQLPGSGLSAAISVVTLAQGVGFAAGFVLGGLALRHVPITVFFWLVAAAAGASTAGLLAVVPRGGGTGGLRVGIVGAVGLIGWLVPLLFGLAQAPSWGYTSPGVVIPVLLGLAGAAVWIRSERRSAAPVFDTELLAAPAVWRACVAGAALGAALYLLLVLAPSYLQMPPEAGYGFGLDALGTGLLLLPEAATVLLAGVLAGGLAARGAALPMAAAGSVVVAVAFVWLAIAHDAPWHYLVGSAVFGLGFGTATAGVFGSAQAAVDAERSGMATGIVATALAIGSGVGAPLAAAVLTAEQAPPGSGVPAAHLFAVGYSAAAVLAVLAAAACVVGAGRSVPAG